MNEMPGKIDITQFMDDDQIKLYRMFNGMLPSEVAYMRGDKVPAAPSVPNTSSKYLNSPLFRDAFTTMALRRSGDDVSVTYDIPTMSRGIADVTDFIRNAAILEAEKKRLPEFAAWLDARKPIDFDPDRIANGKPGTLANEIHKFQSESGMTMKFVNNQAATTDMEYLMQVVGHTHDLTHLVSGFGPNMAGEQANTVMAVATAYNYFSPEAANVITFTLGYASSVLLPRVLFNYPDGVSIVLESMRRGIEAGQACKVPLFMLDFDHYLDWQMDDIAADLGFKRGPGKEWDFSEQLCTG